MKETYYTLHEHEWLAIKINVTYCCCNVKCTEALGRMIDLVLSV